MSVKKRILTSGLKIEFVAKMIGVSASLLSCYLNEGRKSSRPMPSKVAKKIDELLKIYENLPHV